MNIYGFFAAFVINLFSISAIANHGGLHLQVANKTIDISKSDLEEVQVFHSGKNVAAAMIRLKPNVAARLNKLTAQHIGQPILWIWNGRVLCTQNLRSPLSEDITVHNFTPFEAEDFSHSIGLASN